MTPDKIAQLVISAIVVLGFGGVAIAMLVAPPAVEHKDVVLLIFGALNSGYGVVIGYWFARLRDEAPK